MHYGSATRQNCMVEQKQEQKYSVYIKHRRPGYPCNVFFVWRKDVSYIGNNVESLKEMFIEVLQKSYPTYTVEKILIEQKMS